MAIHDSEGNHIMKNTVKRGVYRFVYQQRCFSLHNNILPTLRGSLRALK